MYSSCTYCKQNIFYKSNVAGPIELQLQDDISILMKTLSYFLIRQFG